MYTYTDIKNFHNIPAIIFTIAYRNVKEIRTGNVFFSRYYLRQFETWLSFACATISLMISTDGGHTDVTIQPRGKELNPTEHRPQWVLHSISLAILLAWMQMMLLVGRLPTCGYYALMFSTVLKNILKVSRDTIREELFTAR